MHIKKENKSSLGNFEQKWKGWEMPWGGKFHGHFLFCDDGQFIDLSKSQQSLDRFQPSYTQMLRISSSFRFGRFQNQIQQLFLLQKKFVMIIQILSASH